jgi:hypothetical protein
LFWLFDYTAYGNPAVETVLPRLVFEAAKLPELVVALPDSVNALCWFAWPMADSALEPDGSGFGTAAETALPRLVFEAARLHEVSVVVPDTHFPYCAFIWPMMDCALVPELVDVCATAAFDVVVARASSPAANIVATIGSNFVVLIFCY